MFRFAILIAAIGGLALMLRADDKATPADTKTVTLKITGMT